jgi:transcriptional regulator with XRE-family HTH domain
MPFRRIQLLPQDLTECRKAKDISLLQIAETTKISLRYLEAIERGAFQKLPGGVYTESYIRQYARAIGDTDNVLLDYYRNVFVPETAPPAADPAPQWWMDRWRDFVRSILGLAKESALPLRKRRAV